jgi:hypothetical protein
MVQLLRFGVLLVALSFAGIAVTTPALASTTTSASLLLFNLPAVGNAPAVQVASNWTFMGCWTPRNGAPCSDVFRDPQGGLWICKACGTTGNPTPGKCRRTTQAELDRGLWCS